MASGLLDRKDGPMDISGDYELTRDEFKRAMGAIIGRQRLIIIWMMTPVLAAVGLMRVTSGDAGFGTFLLACGLLCGPSAIWQVARTARLQAPQFCVPTAVRLTNEAYHVKTALYTSIRSWASFLKIRETREFWLLHTHQRFAVIIPKRAFDAAQQREINDFLRGASTTAMRLREA